MGKQPKEVLDALDEFINVVKIESKAAAKFLASIAEKPTYEELFMPYCQNIVNRRISRRRGTDGLREKFSNGDRDNLAYIDITKAGKGELIDVKKARFHQEKQVKQMQRNISKISRQETIIDGQLTLGDMKTKNVEAI